MALVWLESIPGDKGDNNKKKSMQFSLDNNTIQHSFFFAFVHDNEFRNQRKSEKFHQSEWNEIQKGERERENKNKFETFKQPNSREIVIILDSVDIGCYFGLYLVYNHWNLYESHLYERLNMLLWLFFGKKIEEEKIRWIYTIRQYVVGFVYIFI